MNYPIPLRAAVLGPLVAALFLFVSAGCRRVDVMDNGSVGTTPATDVDAGESGNGGLLGGIDQHIKDGGGNPSMGAGGSGGNATDSGSSGGGMADSGQPVGVADSGIAIDHAIADVSVLLAGLNAITLPAVGTEGVSLLQYSAAGKALTIHVDWSGGAVRWYEAAQPRYIYTAASGNRHVDLLYTASYGIYSNGGSAELSGTPGNYKEFIAANDQGFAWVDYQPTGPGHGVADARPGSAFGKIVFQGWSGPRIDLTDALRYRGRLELSKTQVAFVEYATTTSMGQIVVHGIGSGAPAIVAASSPHHQDRPAIEGDWVVWEEYPSATDAIIRARNLVTGQVRDLSSSTGFRTNPDILGTRVIWEDQRNGNGDIYFTDLADGRPERVAVSGNGHSTGARLTPDGLVWIESNNGVTGLLKARWTQ